MCAVSNGYGIGRRQRFQFIFIERCEMFIHRSVSSTTIVDMKLNVSSIREQATDSDKLSQEKNLVSTVNIGPRSKGCHYCCAGVIDGDCPFFEDKESSYALQSLRRGSRLMNITAILEFSLFGVGLKAPVLLL
jgi:hypothetical protein